MKIQQAIAEAEKIAETKKGKILWKQKTAEERVAEQKKKLLEEEEKKKAFSIINSEIKRQNAERKKRKDQYKVEKVKERLEFDDVRREAFSRQKDEFKSVRLKTQTEAQMQRQLVRTALYNMAVWNVWDMDVVKSIISNPGSTKKLTIPEMVRRKVSGSIEHKRNTSRGT